MLGKHNPIVVATRGSVGVLKILAAYRDVTYEGTSPDLLSQSIDAADRRHDALQKFLL
jgi:hypothetical protein